MLSNSKYFLPKLLIFIFYFLPFFSFLIASQWATSQFNQHSSQFSPQQLLLQQQQQSLINPLPYQYQRQIRPSLYDPVLKVKSHIGYLPVSASTGTFVRIATSEQSPPLQILVEDKDLQPGTPSAVYQYVLSGYGAERFAVDHQGNLYLADATNLGLLETTETDKTENTPFVLHVIAKEMDTEPKRNSLPISIIIQLINENKEQQKQKNYYSEELQPSTEEIKQSIYIANVSALAIGERAIAQIKARDGDGIGNVIYRIIDVSDGAFSSFRYDEISNELRAVGPLLPGHKYKVVIEARDSDGLVGHAVVLVQALSHVPTPQTHSLPNNQFLSSQLINQQQNQNKIPSSQELLSSLNSLSKGRQISVEGHSLPSQQHSNLEQFISVDLSELTPIGTFVTALGGNTKNQLEQSERHSTKYFRLIGDGDEGKFILEPESGILFTRANLDREKDKIHRLRIETRFHIPFDQLLYVTNVKVNVLDANDNAPHFVDPQPLILRKRLDELSPFSFPQTTNLLLGRINVADADEGENARISLKVLPPLDRLFIVNDDGEIRVNGPLTAAHLGEHHLTLMAIDHGQQPLEARAVVSVRIDGRFGSNVHETFGERGETTTTPLILPFTTSVSPKIFSQGNNKHLPISSSSSISSQSSSAIENENINLRHLSNSKQISDESAALERNYERQLFGVLSRVGMTRNGKENKIEGESQLLNPFPTKNPPPPFTRVDIPLPLPPSSSSLPQAAIGKVSLVTPNRQKIKENNLGEINENNKEMTTTKTIQQTNVPLSYSPPIISPSFNQTNLPLPISEYPTTINSPINLKTLTTNSLISSTLSSIVLPVSSSQLIPTSTEIQIEDKTKINTRLAPIFASDSLKISVEENEEQMELATLSANYPDEGPGPINYVLLAGDQSIFSINASNGIVTLLKALDAESTNVPDQPPIYHLKVGTIEAVELQYLENGQKIDLVTDPGLAHFCDIQINVVDINDWIPNFEQNLYEFTIPATAEPGTIVGQVHAFDQDITSPNNRLFYYIIPKKNNSSIKSIDAKQFFSLNSQTGQLKTNSNLKNFVGRILKFRIQVVDGGIDGTELNSTSEIAVHLEGIRRHEEKKALTATTSWQAIEEVDEEEEKDEEKEEEEEEKQNTLSHQNKTTKQFGNNKNEELVTSTEIVMPSESLTNIENSSPSSLNQNKIKFSSHNFNCSIIEGTRPPVFLTILPVINKPSDTRFTICAIRNGNLRGAFSVAQNGEGDCELRTQMQLDREAIPNYLLNITVENGGEQDWTLANISVLDVNDNRPKFVFNKIENEGERKNEKLGPESFFAVLPVETMANQRFYKITAEDGDEPGNGNSLINYSIDIEETRQSEGGHLFGIDPQSGELWPKKGADEFAQLSKKNFFRITVIACDNPGEPKRRLCSRTPVSISLLDDRHRFVLIFSGMIAEQIKQQEKEILNSLRPFTFPCSNPIIERVEEEEKDIKRYLKRSKEENEYLVYVILYAANLKERKICLKKEMKKIFFSDTKEAITAAMRQWGAELLDILENGANNGIIILNQNKYKNNTSIRSRPIYSAKTHDKEEIDEFSSGVTGLASLLFPIDWSNSNTINALIGIAVIVTFIALVGLIALCVFRYRHRKMRRHRAEQIRRRHHQHQQQAYRIGGVGGGFHSAAGLLAAVNGAKAASNYSTHFDSGGILNNNGGIFNRSAGCTTGHSCLFGSNNFYMPSNSSGTPLGMRELPVCDDENFIPRNWQNIKRNQHNCNLHRQNNEQQTNTEFHPSSPPSSPPSSNQRLNGSSLLLLPPPPDPPPQPPAQRKIGRRLTNSENAPTSTINSGLLPRQNLKHYSPPATIGLQRNHEGDFSIDESFYAANGQARCIY